jgi:hypothetical protein
MYCSDSHIVFNNILCEKIINSKAFYETANYPLMNNAILRFIYIILKVFTMIQISASLLVPLSVNKT